MSIIIPGTVIEGYEFIRRIGQGGYSDVYRVRSLQFDRLFVAKVIVAKMLNRAAAKSSFEREVRALTSLDHPNIVRLYDYFVLDARMILILEHCADGSLEDYVRQQGRIRGGRLVRMIRDVCGAVQHAWAHGVRHRDIKPANILFDESGRAKLADFGISLSGGEDMVRDFRCSPVCASPEIIQKTGHDPVKSDIWALGITILWVAGGEIPFAAMDVDALNEQIKAGKYVVPDGMDGEVAGWVKKMLNANPEERMIPEVHEMNEVLKKMSFPRLSPGAHKMVLELSKRTGKNRLVTSVNVEMAKCCRRRSFGVAVPVGISLPRALKKNAAGAV